MHVIAVYLGDVWIRHHDEGKVSQRLDPVRQPGRQYGEGEVGRVKELVG